MLLPLYFSRSVQGILITGDVGIAAAISPIHRLEYFMENSGVRDEHG
jgi:hypothetical protein